MMTCEKAPTRGAASAVEQRVIRNAMPGNLGTLCFDVFQEPEPLQWPNKSCSSRGLTTYDDILDNSGLVLQASALAQKGAAMDEPAGHQACDVRTVLLAAAGGSVSWTGKELVALSFLLGSGSLPMKARFQDSGGFWLEPQPPDAQQNACPGTSETRMSGTTLPFNDPRILVC